MYALDKIKNEIAEAINKTLKTEIAQAHELVSPPNVEMGDLSYPCFTAARETGKNPAEIAGDLVKNLVKPEIVASASAMGPYLNFIFNEEILAAGVIGDIGRQGDKYGINNSGGDQRVMIEYSNGNTHKECHVGHVRNICYGDAVHKLQLANGFKSIPVSYINDFGINVAKTVWWTFHPDNPEKKIVDKRKMGNKGNFLGKMYVAASEREKEDKTAKQMIQFTMKKIESRDSKEYRLWQETRQWTIEQLDNIYKDLGVSFKKTYYESELIETG